MTKWLFKLGCFSMFAGIALGDKYVHHGQLSEQGSDLFFKAQLYNTANTLGLFGCTLAKTSTLPLKVAAGGFIAGQLLFIAPLYINSIFGRQPQFSMIIPLGGVAIMTAWPALLFT